MAARALLDLGPPASAAEAKRNIVEAVDHVAARLGNTRAVCRACYIHPAIIDAYGDGTLHEFADVLAPGRAAQVSADERFLLEFLKTRASAKEVRAA